MRINEVNAHTIFIFAFKFLLFYSAFVAGQSTNFLKRREKKILTWIQFSHKKKKIWRVRSANVYLIIHAMFHRIRSFFFWFEFDGLIGCSCGGKCSFIVLYEFQALSIS